VADEPSLFDRKQAWHRALVKSGARDVDKLLARAVTDYMLRDLESFPGRERLCLDTGLHPSTVTASVARLEDAGVWTVDRSARKGNGRQGAPVIALVWPFDAGRASQVLGARTPWVDRRAAKETRGAESRYRDPGQSRGTAAPESSGEGSRVAVPRRQSRGTTTPREGREPGEEKGKRRHPLSPYKKWTAADCERPCPSGHGPMQAKQNGGDGSLYGECLTCGEKCNPHREQRDRFPPDEQQERKEAALRARPRFPYPGTTDPAPVGALTPAASELLARSESA
jgi:DNA-binding transcriptional ArsR family regulator